jgi:polyisoprenyl-phosphate glycosyltransferase
MSASEPSAERTLEVAPEVLTILVPCYNEEAVLQETARQLADILDQLKRDGLAHQDSRVVFIDDGSRDRTWVLIEDLARCFSHFAGMKLSRNVGHQNALLSGLLNADGDVLISIDADLQDDVGAMKDMLVAHRNGADIVYGVRRRRNVDTIFKRKTAEAYYRILQLFGINAIFNHADYRLMSRRSVEALRDFGEVNLFLRGIIPQLGFPTQVVTYDRKARFAGETKYTFWKMFALGAEGITSFSIGPLRLIASAGLVVSFSSFLVGIWAFVARLLGQTVPGWASTVVPLYFLGGIQLLSLGVIGEYLGKVYLETKGRPRFIVEKVVGDVSIRRNRAS